MLGCIPECKTGGRAIKISVKAGGAGIWPNILLKSIRFCSNLVLSGFGCKGFLGNTYVLIGNGNLGVKSCLEMSGVCLTKKNLIKKL